MIKKRSARTAMLACASVAALGLLVGASPAAAKTKTKTATFAQCVNFAVPIPDFVSGGDGVYTSATASVPVTVPKFKGKRQDGVVTAFNSAGVRISHTFDSDILFYLVSPGGKASLLSAFRAGTGDGYGSGAASCSGSLVGFADSFATPIGTPGNTGNNPVVGNFKPEQPLSTLVGGPARGNWTLLATDTSSSDSGTINAVSLNFTYQYKKFIKKKKK